MNAIKQRRAGVAVDAGDRSEGAFYCSVQGGGGGAEYSGPASQIAEIVDAFPWLEMKQRFARAVCWVVETHPATTSRAISGSVSCLATSAEIRRLWAIRDTEGLRVLVQLEPALDSSAIHPAWMANRDVRIDELR